jgi:hypothetical protein
MRSRAFDAFMLDRAIDLVTGPMACDWSMKYESVMGHLEQPHSF